MSTRLEKEKCMLLCPLYPQKLVLTVFATRLLVMAAPESTSSKKSIKNARRVKHNQQLIKKKEIEEGFRIIKSNEKIIITIVHMESPAISFALAYALENIKKILPRTLTTKRIYIYIHHAHSERGKRENSLPLNHLYNSHLKTVNLHIAHHYSSVYMCCCLHYPSTQTKQKRQSR